MEVADIRGEELEEAPSGGGIGREEGWERRRGLGWTVPATSLPTAAGSLPGKRQKALAGHRESLCKSMLVGSTAASRSEHRMRPPGGFSPGLTRCLRA